MAEYLGPRKYSLEIANRKPEVGVATGLAWTSYGGEILFCETTQMSGKGGIVLTGLLGEVMKESARIALSYLKANQDKLGIPKDAFDKRDIHIHFPAGGVPKEGPSAGITLTTALASLLTNKKVKHDMAMTGEVTLLGKVLPVGGIKEKMLAAKRAGIKKLILPLENKPGMADFEEDIMQGMEINYVSHVSEVLELVLEGGLKPAKAKQMSKKAKA